MDKELERAFEVAGIHLVGALVRYLLGGDYSRPDFPDFEVDGGQSAASFQQFAKPAERREASPHKGFYINVMRRSEIPVKLRESS